MVKCEICGKELKNEKGLKIHKAKAHKGEKKPKKKEEKKKKQDKEEKTVQVCPDCGSPRLEYASMDTRSVKTIIGLGAPNKYYCKDCGYEGSVKLEAPVSEIEEMRPKDSKTQERERIEREREGKKAPETPSVLKPISIILILGFLITAVFVALTPIRREALPYYGGEPETLTNETLNLTEEREDPYLREPWEEHPETEPVRRATGIQMVTGFLVPLLIIFFLVGLLVYLIWYYANRLTHMK